MHTPVHIYNCIKPCKIKCRDTIAHDFLCNTVRMCRGQYDIRTLSARRSALLWVATENGEQLFLKALEEGERGTAYVGAPGQQNCIWGGKCGRRGVGTDCKDSTPKVCAWERPKTEREESALPSTLHQRALLNWPIPHHTKTNLVATQTLWERQNWGTESMVVAPVASQSHWWSLDLKSQRKEGRI